MKYILAIDAYTGDDTFRHQNAETLFAIVSIDDDGAEIIDDGYRTREEAKAAWPEAN